MLPRLSPHPGLFLAAALAGASGPAGCGDEACRSCGRAEAAGALKNPNIQETSGLATSAIHDDVFYAHNDRGDGSRFFAFARDGADLGTYNVQDAENLDWEDMAQGPCAAGSCIFIGDIGDNTGERIYYTLYRIPEPATVGPGEYEVASERFVFTYPDMVNDAETLLVHPVTGVVTIVTKTDGAAKIFELIPPFSTAKTHMAVRSGEVEAPGGGKFTGGAINPDGTAIVLRTTQGLVRYAMTPDQSAAEALAGAPCPLPSALETDGESVTWLPSNAGFMTIGEGVGAEIHVTACDA